MDFLLNMDHVRITFLLFKEILLCQYCTLRGCFDRKNSHGISGGFDIFKRPNLINRHFNLTPSYTVKITLTTLLGFSSDYS